MICRRLRKACASYEPARHKERLEQLKALARARCGSGCFCEYVELIEGQALTTPQDQTLTRNRECYERHNDRNAHVGLQHYASFSALSKIEQLRLRPLLGY